MSSLVCTTRSKARVAASRPLSSAFFNLSISPMVRPSMRTRSYAVVMRRNIEGELLDHKKCTREYNQYNRGDERSSWFIAKDTTYPSERTCSLRKSIGWCMHVC